MARQPGLVRAKILIRLFIYKHQLRALLYHPKLLGLQAAQRALRGKSVMYRMDVNFPDRSVSVRGDGGLIAECHLEGTFHAADYQA